MTSRTEELVSFQDHSKCPEFDYVTGDEIVRIEVTAGWGDALLVDSFKLYESSDVIQSWWEDNGEAACLSMMHDAACHSALPDAEHAVKGVKLNMRGSTRFMLYDDDTPCSLDSQCVNDCVNGVCGTNTGDCEDDELCRVTTSSIKAVTEKTGWILDDMDTYVDIIARISEVYWLLEALYYSSTFVKFGTKLASNIPYIGKPLFQVSSQLQCLRYTSHFAQGPPNLW